MDSFKKDIPICMVNTGNEPLTRSTVLLVSLDAKVGMIKHFSPFLKGDGIAYLG